MNSEQYTGVIGNVTEKGFGFVKVDGHTKDIFFHASQVLNVPFNDLRKGDKVLVDSIVEGNKGPVAEGISLIQD